MLCSNVVTFGDKDDKRMKFLSVPPCIYHAASQCSLMKYSNYDKK